MATTKKSFTTTFTKEKDTLNTVRYAEVVPEDDAANVRTLYIQKHAAKALGNPDTITVTVEAG